MNTPRIAIVTGAARGLGAAIARRLAADGHSVAALDLNEEACAETVRAIEDAGQRALAVQVDVSDEDSVRKALASVVGRLGTPTVLVNNAGLTRENMIHKATLAEWDLVINTNLRGSFLLCREMRPFFKSAGWGRVVNISSTGALGLVGQAGYSAAKAGVQGLTKSLSLEFGPLGVTVNAVAPGYVTTDLTRATAARVGSTVDDFERNAAAASAVGRHGRPEDIAHAVAFFVDERSGFVTGQVLYVAGSPKA